MSFIKCKFMSWPKKIDFHNTQGLWWLFLYMAGNGPTERLAKNILRNVVMIKSLFSMRAQFVFEAPIPVLKIIAIYEYQVMSKTWNHPLTPKSNFLSASGWGPWPPRGYQTPGKWPLAN